MEIPMGLLNENISRNNPPNIIHDKALLCPFKIVNATTSISIKLGKALLMLK